MYLKYLSLIKWPFIICLWKNDIHDAVGTATLWFAVSSEPEAISVHQARLVDIRALPFSYSFIVINLFICHFPIYQILARRCLEAGIYQVECGDKVEPNTKAHAFIQALESNGIALKESKRYNHVGATHWERPEKPWTVIVD